MLTLMPELPCRVLVTGAGGAGTTTLASALAARWSVPHADADDYYWLPTDPPYRDKREPEHRVDLMELLFLPRPAWALSGSVTGWQGAEDRVVDRVQAVVFLTLDPATRMARLEDRQRRRYGAEAIAPGGPLHEDHRAFLAWCAGYDDPHFDGRNILAHREWLSSIGRPVVELDAGAPPDELLRACESRLREVLT